jgi:uroporphyrin-III C-methyltransferase
VLAERLLAAGRAASTPVVVVENASLPNARRTLTTLSRLGEATRDLEGPALLVVGEVAALADVETITSQSGAQLSKPGEIAS